MREYDDDIRLYTPVLQRVIILVAVIIAVPVVLWTITAFVRTYVAPPKAPTFQRMALPNRRNKRRCRPPRLPATSHPRQAAPLGMQASSSPAPQPSAPMASAAAMATRRAHSAP